jgi:hypothetical protein
MLKKPAKFDGSLVYDQMVNGGLVEAVKARQAGYATRIPHKDFVRQFKCLVRFKSLDDDPDALVGGELTGVLGRIQQVEQAQRRSQQSARQQATNKRKETWREKSRKLIAHLRALIPHIVNDATVQVRFRRPVTRVLTGTRATRWARRKCF